MGHRPASSSGYLWRSLPDVADRLGNGLINVRLEVPPEMREQVFQKTLWRFDPVHARDSYGETFVSVLETKAIPMWTRRCSGWRRSRTRRPVCRGGTRRRSSAGPPGGCRGRRTRPSPVRRGTPGRTVVPAPPRRRSRRTGTGWSAVAVFGSRRRSRRPRPVR